MMKNAIPYKSENHRNIRIGVREKTIISIVISITILGAIILYGNSITENQISINLMNKDLKPSLSHLFGTDWIGRDMLLRTIKGLSISIQIGMIASIVSGIIALILGLLGSTSFKWLDSFVTWIIDLFLAIPHTLIVILICISAGGGIKGMILGVSFTHWASLARIIRGEVSQIKQSEYIKVSKNLGKSNMYIATNHIIPHIIPQLLIGIVLVFPHAILHEASVTFLGFGLAPHEPAIGIILSEAMKHISSGKWWLVFFPGLSLVLVSMMVDNIAKLVNKLINPKEAYK